MPRKEALLAQLKLVNHHPYESDFNFYTCRRSEAQVCLLALRLEGSPRFCRGDMPFATCVALGAYTRIRRRALLRYHGLLPLYC